MSSLGFGQDGVDEGAVAGVITLAIGLLQPVQLTDFL